MKLVDVNWNPSDRQLRQFGWIALAMFPALAWIWTDGAVAAVLVAVAVGGALAGLGFAYPRGLRPIYVGLCLLTLPIGLVVSEVMLMLLFYGILFPLGMVFRLVGRDGLQRRLNPKAVTYWQPRKQPTGAASYLRQW